MNKRELTPFITIINNHCSIICKEKECSQWYLRSNCNFGKEIAKKAIEIKSILDKNKIDKEEFKKLFIELWSPIIKQSIVINGICSLDLEINYNEFYVEQHSSSTLEDKILEIINLSTSQKINKKSFINNITIEYFEAMYILNIKIEEVINK